MQQDAHAPDRVNSQSQPISCIVPAIGISDQLLSKYSQQQGNRARAKITQNTEKEREGYPNSLVSSC
jgi:hypothetical protein